MLKPKIVIFNAVILMSLVWYKMLMIIGYETLDNVESSYTTKNRP